MKNDVRQLLDVSEVAHILGLTPLTIRRYIYRGLLKSTRTPGGHHRICADEIELLKANFSNTKTSSNLQDDVAFISRLYRLEREVDILRKQLSVVSSGCINRFKDWVEVSSPKTRRELSGVLVFSVLGPGCQACDHLARLTEEVLRELRPEFAEVRRIRDLQEIAEYGPLLTPALVLEGNTLVSGVVPSKKQLAEAIQASLN